MRRVGDGSWLVFGAAVLTVLGAGAWGDVPATGKAAAPETAPAPEKAFAVTELKLSYRNENKWQPPLADLMDAQVSLGIEGGVYVAAEPGAVATTVKLRDIGKGAVQQISASGLNAVYKAVLKGINDRGIVGVFAVVDPADIGGPGDADLRGGRTSLNVVIVVAQVTEIRTVCIDAALPPEAGVNRAQDAFILANSPIKPVGADGKGGPNLVDKTALDAYVVKLDQDPALHVDVAIQGTADPGLITLDYLVTRKSAGAQAEGK